MGHGAVPIWRFLYFINKLIKGEEIIVYDRDQSRDFTYIDDIVTGITLAFEQKGISEIYNLGSGTPIQLNELITSLGVYFPDAKILDGTFRPGDVRHTWSGISKAREELGYTPKVKFEEGLRRTIEWAKKYHAY